MRGRASKTTCKAGTNFTEVCSSPAQDGTYGANKDGSMGPRDSAVATTRSVELQQEKRRGNRSLDRKKASHTAQPSRKQGLTHHCTCAGWGAMVSAARPAIRWAKLCSCHFREGLGLVGLYQRDNPERSALARTASRKKKPRPGWARLQEATSNRASPKEARNWLTIF